jgi:hypothetical protein
VNHAPAVSVVVPFRGDGGGARDKAWTYLRGWWALNHPDWTVIEGTCPPGQPWCKGVAVACALRHQPPSAVLVVADADVICPGVDDAVHIISTGQAQWAMPHQRVNRLTPAASAAILAGAPLPTAAHLAGPATVAQSYKGAEGGGMVVLPTDVYQRVPLDTRFTGWGQEDTSWALALRVLAGRPWRSPMAPLLHLWHPPEPRVNVWQGCAANVALYYRYRATTTTEGMLAILAEMGPAAC